MSGIKKSEPVASFKHPERVSGDELGEAPEPRPEWALSDDRIPVFDYEDADGNTITVTMPAKPNPGLALNFLRQSRRIGAELGISWLIEEAIGEEGYDALVAELTDMPDPENGQAIMRDIGQRVQLAVMGGLEGPKA